MLLLLLGRFVYKQHFLVLLTCLPWFKIGEYAGKLTTITSVTICWNKKVSQFFLKLLQK